MSRFGEKWVSGLAWRGAEGPGQGLVIVWGLGSEVTHNAGQIRHRIAAGGIVVTVDVGQYFVIRAVKGTFPFAVSSSYRYTANGA